MRFISSRPAIAIVVTLLTVIVCSFGIRAELKEANQSVLNPRFHSNSGASARIESRSGTDSEDAGHEQHPSALRHQDHADRHMLERVGQFALPQIGVAHMRVNAQCPLHVRHQCLEQRHIVAIKVGSPDRTHNRDFGTHHRALMYGRTNRLGDVEWKAVVGIPLAAQQRLA
jgi:hypothetical protein